MKLKGKQNPASKLNNALSILVEAARKRVLLGKLAAALLLACAISMAAGAFTRGFFQAASPLPGTIAKYMPEGALLYIEAGDFGQIMKDWNASPEKHAWVESDNHSIFSKSRLFLRLQDAQKGFAAAAGLPPDMKFLDQIAGDRSALAIYDIGNLEFLYVSRLQSAKAMQSTLWQTRGKFEPREASGKAFYVRQDQDSSRTVAFAVEGDYLILATREELVAGALELMSGKAGRTLDQEAWFAKAVSAASTPGDMRMVMDLEKIAVTPHFRTYWIQQNITETAGYLAGVSDLYRAADQYREERILLRKPQDQVARAKPAASPAAKKPAQEPTPIFSAEGGKAVAEMLRFVPADYGVYRAFSNPSVEQCIASLNRRILSPHHELAAVEQSAPSVALGGGQTGDASDLETRIDVAPQEHQEITADAAAPLRDAVTKTGPLALLVLESSRRNTDGVLLSVSSAVIIAGTSDWESVSARRSLQYALAPGLSTARLGVQWQETKDAPGAYQLDGLATLQMATRGRFLIVANDPALFAAILQAANKTKTALDDKSATLSYSASLNHARERGNFRDLTKVLDDGFRSNGEGAAGEPAFFSRNIASLSEMFSGVASESMEVHEADGNVRQTVTYQWAR